MDFKTYKTHLLKCPGLNITLDTAAMDAPSDLYTSRADAIEHATDAMAALEQGAIANPDEDRMVGHYWLRAPQLAPNDELRDAIRRDLDACLDFAKQVHTKAVAPPHEKAAKFTDLLIIGIGGSALGPQLTAHALGTKRDKLRVHCFDNTDPDGLSLTLQGIGSKLKSTLVLVVSKSGGTPETRNGMLHAQAAFKHAGLDFAQQAVAVTGVGSKLDQVAESEGWLARFPMYDWVGGRTSLWSAVGVLPMALQGCDVMKFLEGAAKMDVLTRGTNPKKNPAMTLAVQWHHATNGRGEKDMVVLPYKDRLVLFSKYLQQLVMESLGKKHDLDGNVVHQGIAVYGNKGSTDQHAYVQQLRDGVANFFATFIVVLQDTARPGRDELYVEDGVTAGDYLHGFYQGTRQALHEAGRPSLSIVCDKLDARTLGALIALYERAVGFYASLVNVNAYHQPGVEAGKKAAASVLELQDKVLTYLGEAEGPAAPDAIAAAVDAADASASVYLLCEHLTANKRLKRTGGGYTTTA